MQSKTYNCQGFDYPWSENFYTNNVTSNTSKNSAFVGTHAFLALIPHGTYDGLQFYDKMLHNLPNMQKTELFKIIIILNIDCST